MRTLHCLGLALFLLTAAAPFGHAGDAQEALTGTYVGTLARVRLLTADSGNSERTVKQKTVTKVTGIGYVPAGGHTFIRLILPGRNMFDDGVDQQITLDFSTIPTKVIVLDGTQAKDVTIFATVTVQGKRVKCVLKFSNNDPDFTTEDIRTLTITRTKP
jgi:hypothetical protein